MLLLGEYHLRSPPGTFQVPRDCAAPWVHFCPVDRHGIVAQQQRPHKLFHHYDWVGNPAQAFPCPSTAPTQNLSNWTAYSLNSERTPLLLPPPPRLLLLLLLWENLCILQLWTSLDAVGVRWPLGWFPQQPTTPVLLVLRCFALSCLVPGVVAHHACVTWHVVRAYLRRTHCVLLPAVLFFCLLLLLRRCCRRRLLLLLLLLPCC